MGAVMEIYQDLGLLERTAVFMTALNGTASQGGMLAATDNEVPRVPWLAWGVGIKPGHVITQPVSILDTGATVLRTLGLETHTEWESRTVEEIFTTPRATRDTHAD